VAVISENITMWLAAGQCNPGWPAKLSANQLYGQKKWHGISSSAFWQAHQCQWLSSLSPANVNGYLFM